MKDNTTITSDIKYLIEIPDSQHYTTLEQIKNSLRVMEKYYDLIRDDKDKLPKPPIDFTFEHMIKGIENSINKGYNLYCTGSEKNGKKN